MYVSAAYYLLILIMESKMGEKATWVNPKQNVGCSIQLVKIIDKTRLSEGTPFKITAVVFICIA